MRRVSISYGFSKLWCVCSFLRSFVRSFVCNVFVCLFVFVRFEKCRRLIQRKEEKAPPRPLQLHNKKKIVVVKKRWYSSSSVALPGLSLGCV